MLMWLPEPKWVKLCEVSLSALNSCHIGVLFFICNFSNEFIAFFSEDSPNLQAAIDGPGKWTGQPLVQCTSHMCPIRIHWHVKLNYKEYWRVKITITNFNFRMNYTQWNLVAQHPNFDNISSRDFQQLK
jgi:hypothetical protein